MNFFKLKKSIFLYLNIFEVNQKFSMVFSGESNSWNKQNYLKQRQKNINYNKEYTIITAYIRSLKINYSFIKTKKEHFLHSKNTYSKIFIPRSRIVNLKHMLVKFKVSLMIWNIFLFLRIIFFLLFHLFKTPIHFCCKKSYKCKA